MDLLDKLHQLRLETWEIKHTMWQQSFLTAKWWFIAIVVAVSYALWWKLVDKRRILELLLFGSFIAVSRVIFDDWGISSGRWTYILDLVPLGFSLFLNDLTVVPLAYMLAYQYSPSWSRYFVYIIVVQSLISFAFLPLLTAMDILRLHNWKYLYTFLFMIFTASVMRAIMLWGLKIQENVRMEYGIGTSLGLKIKPALKPLDDPSNKDDKE